MRLTVLVSSAVLALGVASPAVAQVAMVPDGTLLDVSAEGRTARTPDIATIRAGVVSQAPTAAAALGDNAARMARVLAALAKAGVAPRDVQTATVSLSPQYRYVDGQPPAVTGYQAGNSVAIRFRDVARSGTILDTLVGQGANQIDGPSLSIDHPEAALDEARIAAVQVARARAELYAKAAGLAVARIVSITEGNTNHGDPPRPVLYARAMAAAPAPTEIAAGETEVSVTLSVRFLLK